MSKPETTKFEESLAKKNAFDGSLAYGTGTFNRTTGREAHLKRREGMRAWFTDPVTGLLRADIAVSRGRCPVCPSTERSPLFVKDGFSHLRCAACGMVYVDPIVRADVLARYYEEESSWTEVLLSEAQREMDERKFRYGLERIEAYLPNRGRLLDVGCGPGLFLKVARTAKWEVEGLEPNKRCLPHLERLGIPVITEPFPSARLPVGAYDAVTLWEVLEHIAEPRGFLEAVWALLRPGGVAFICVPNIDALINRILHEKAGTFAGYSHLNFFNPQSLSRLVESVGLAVRELETIITELGTINNYLSYEEPYLGEANPVLACLTPAFIHQHLLGSRLILVAQAVEQVTS